MRKKQFKKCIFSNKILNPQQAFKLKTTQALNKTHC